MTLLCGVYFVYGLLDMAMSDSTAASSSDLLSSCMLSSALVNSFRLFFLLDSPFAAGLASRVEDESSPPPLIVFVSSPPLLGLVLLSSETTRCFGALLLQSPSRMGRRHSKISWGAVTTLISAAERFFPFKEEEAFAAASGKGEDDKGGGGGGAIFLLSEEEDAVSSTSASLVRMEDVTSHQIVVKSLRMRQTLQVGAMARRRPVVTVESKSVSQNRAQVTHKRLIIPIEKQMQYTPPSVKDSPDEDEVSARDSFDSRYPESSSSDDDPRCCSDDKRADALLAVTAAPLTSSL